MDQYFTTNRLLLNASNEELESIDSDKSIETFKILEPSAGRGDIIFNCFDESMFQNITCVEIDDSIIFNLVSNKINVINEDFLKHDFKNQTFDLIIGNPPFSLTSEFIIKCFNLLSSKGYFIFIVPDNTLRLTKNTNMLSLMNKHGTFKSIRKYTNEKMFKNASVSVMIFTYVKSIASHSVLYSVDNKEQIMKNYIINPLFQFVESNEQIQLNLIFNVHVGFVSGADKILKTNDQHVDKHTINILKKENCYETFYDPIDENEALTIPIFVKNKEELMNRKIKHFDSSNWWNFGLKRNESIIADNIDKPCIYIYNQTRNKKVSFIGKVQPFGGNLLCLIPKNENEDLSYYVNVFNSDEWKQLYVSDNNRFKISHKQLSTSYIKKCCKPNHCLPMVLQEIKQIIINSLEKIDLKSEVDDGRVESSILESKIIDAIKTCSFDEYKLFIPPSRWWFDVCLFKTKTDFIPINIKITTNN